MGTRSSEGNPRAAAPRRAAVDGRGGSWVPGGTVRLRCDVRCIPVALAKPMARSTFLRFDCWWRLCRL